jgi:hypothetical protein
MGWRSRLFRGLCCSLRLRLRSGLRRALRRRSCGAWLGRLRRRWGRSRSRRGCSGRRLCWRSRCTLLLCGSRGGARGFGRGGGNGGLHSLLARSGQAREILLEALKGLSPTARYAPAFRHEIGPAVGFDGSDLVLAWLLRCRLTGTTQSRRQYEDANRSRLCRRKDPHQNPPQYQSFSFCFYRPAPARQSTASWRAGACPRLPYRGCRIWRASP